MTKKCDKNKIRILNCPSCNKTFEAGYKSKKKYCSNECRPSVLNPKPRICLICSTAVYCKSRHRNYCDACVPIKLKQVADAKRVHRPLEAETHRKGRRTVRERLAPGLNQHRRKALLDVWKSQQRECVYCFALADTIDHIVPLSRGGSNELLNLVPCCRKCNSTKGSKLLSEWKPTNVRSSA